MSRLGTGMYALAGLAVVAALGWALAPRPLEVEAAAVTTGHFEQAIEEEGRTRIRDRYVVSSPVAAHLSRISLREGDRVTAGETVAMLTPVMSSLFDERSRREAVARAGAARAAVAGAGARLARARLAWQEAALDLSRHEELARSGYVSLSRLDSLRLSLEASKRELESAEAARDMAGHELEQARASLLPVQPGDGVRIPFPVRTPLSGVVLKVVISSEATIAPGAALLEIGDRQKMEVVAELLTTDAVHARPGTQTLIKRWGGPTLEGRIRRVEPAAFTKVSALGIEEQRVNVLVDITSPASEWMALGDGFRVTVRVITLSTPDAVVVPVGALFPKPDATMAVYVVDGGRARERPVDIAARNNSHGWVRGGLKPGEQVIVYPPPGVADGSRIALRP